MSFEIKIRKQEKFDMKCIHYNILNLCVTSSNFGGFDAYAGNRRQMVHQCTSSIFVKVKLRILFFKNTHVF